MLFFFTLGSSMVGDICDEDDLKTGKRTEGSFYSVYWWFIKMGTALASFVAGALIVFTQFDQTQVTKVDALQGSIRELQSEADARQAGKAPAANLEDLIAKAREKADDLNDHLKTEAKERERSHEHYTVVLENMDTVEVRLAEMDATQPIAQLEGGIKDIEGKIVQLKKQSPYTLLMMRVVEIGLPILLSLFSIFFLLRYSLTGERSQEIKLLLEQRNKGRSEQAT